MGRSYHIDHCPWSPQKHGSLADPDLIASALAIQAPAWTPDQNHTCHGIGLGRQESEFIR